MSDQSQDNLKPRWREGSNCKKYGDAARVSQKLYVFKHNYRPMEWVLKIGRRFFQINDCV